MKRVTGAGPMFSAMTDISSISMPFSGSPSDATSDAAVPVQDDTNIYFQAAPPDQRMNTGLPEIASSASPVEDAINCTMAGGNMGRSASMQRVASPEHLQKRIPGSCGSGHW